MFLNPVRCVGGWEETKMWTAWGFPRTRVRNPAVVEQCNALRRQGLQCLWMNQGGIETILYHTWYLGTLRCHKLPLGFHLCNVLWSSEKYLMGRTGTQKEPEKLQFQTMWLDPRAASSTIDSLSISLYEHGKSIEVFWEGQETLWFGGDWPGKVAECPSVQESQLVISKKDYGNVMSSKLLEFPIVKA